MSKHYLCRLPMQAAAAHARPSMVPRSFSGHCRVSVSRAATVLRQVTSLVHAKQIFSPHFSQKVKNEIVLAKPVIVKLDKYAFQRNIYKTQLIAELESVSKWPLKRGPDKKETIWRFMDSVGDLYMDYFQKHLLEAADCAQCHQDKLKNNYNDIVVFYVFDLMHKLANDDKLGHHWDLACRGRTNAEAFNEMFGHLTGILPIGELVEFIDSRMFNASIAEIPPLFS